MKKVTAIFVSKSEMRQWHRCYCYDWREWHDW